jgi:hypothetical protein
VDELRLPRTQDLRHLRRIDVLVSIFRVVRLEQLGEFLAGVLHEVPERLQAGQDHQVPGIEMLPQLIARHIRVDDDIHLILLLLVTGRGRRR